MAMRSKAVLTLSGALLFVLMNAAPAYAKAFVVNTPADAPDTNPGDGKCAAVENVCTLRAAVMEHNALAAMGAGANMIVLQANVHVLTIAGKGEDNAATGDLDVNGGALTVFGRPHAASIIDGNAADRVFDIGPLTPTQFVLRRVTIQNGNAESTPPNLSSAGPDVGGGIRVLRNSGLRVEDALFRGNRAGARGGGIGLPTPAGIPAGADPAIITEVTDTTFENNSAGGEAGGFFNNRVATLTRVIVRNNLVTGTVGNERGAGIANSGVLTLTDVLVSGNQMPSGSGGGIAVRGDPVANIFGTLQVTNVTVSNNGAPQGGGIGIGNGATATLTNATISGNRAMLGGGLGNGGTVTLTNVTIAGNVGGGLVTAGPPLGAPTARTTLINTILSHSGGVGPNCIPPSPFLPFLRLPTSGGDNISSDQSCMLMGPGDRNGVDPLLGPLADNGGFTPTHALLPGSPAIDTVLHNGCPPPPTDQRGVTRPQDGNNDGEAICDVGAYELGDDD